MDHEDLARAERAAPAEPDLLCRHLRSTGVAASGVWVISGWVDISSGILIVGDWNDSIPRLFKESTTAALRQQGWRDMGSGIHNARGIHPHCFVLMVPLRYIHAAPPGIHLLTSRLLENTAPVSAECGRMSNYCNAASNA